MADRPGALDRIFCARTLFAASAIFVVYAATIPWDLSGWPSIDRIRWTPLFDAARGRPPSLPDIAQNVLLFFPFGLFGWLAGGGRRRIATVGLAGLALSFLVEFLQTMSASRSPTTTDLVTNTLGALAGAAVAAAYTRRVAEPLGRRVRRTLRERPGLLVLIAWLAAILFGSLEPFLPTFDVGTLKANLKGLIANPWGDKGWLELLPDVLNFAALGALVALEGADLFARDDKRPLRVPFAIGAVGLLALALEACQLFLHGHAPGVQDAVAGALGGCLGAVAAALTGARPGRELGDLTRHAPRLVLAFALLAPLVRALEPFEFVAWSERAARIDSWSFVPFASLFGGLKTATFFNVFHAAAIYLPLGWALAALGRSPRYGAIACLLWAEALEVAQIPVAGRTFDVTEGVYAAVMGLFAAWLLRRARRA